jgi:uncharacterized GH25 family protein
MRSRFFLTTLVVITFSLAQAHEFWLQPRKYKFKPGEEMKVDFMVGENFTGEFWDLTVHKVEKAEMYCTGMNKNLLKDIKNSKGTNLIYKFDKEGTHLFSMESNFASIELEGAKFNDYLREDGMDEILDTRTKAQELNKPAKEFYKRFAKLLVQSGAKTDESYKRRLGFRYEIFPMVNPYTLKVGDYLDCRVMWEGKPAPHALVKVWSHIGNRIFLQNIYTENDGTIKFPISGSGPWMISAVKMIQSEMEGADYQSFWSSLVFAIEPQ